MLTLDLQAVEAKLGYGFRDPVLLVRALTHKSFSSESRLPGQSAESAGARHDNEQLEFFGDAILGFLISEALVRDFPDLREGQLSRARSQLVSARNLHEVALRMGLGEFLRLGRGEERSGGRLKKSLLANAVEALIAAVYLDAGDLKAVRQLVETYVYDRNSVVTAVDGTNTNYKGELWERAGAAKLPVPEYVVLEVAGPAHAPEFHIEARLGDRYTGRGRGHSKKAAEQDAARALLETMQALTR